MLTTTLTVAAPSASTDMPAPADQQVYRNIFDRIAARPMTSRDDIDDVSDDEIDAFLATR